MQNVATKDADRLVQGQPSNHLADYPVREYVSAMARELAHMARWDGDERLAAALEAASVLASLDPVSLTPDPPQAGSPDRPG